jgi:recombination protein RecA
MQKLPAEILSTKINKLDEITGIGGFPKGHIVELCGEESCGKTALALTIANNISKQHILFVDTEHTADTKFLLRILCMINWYPKS